jgi:hypothetical protein
MAMPESIIVYRNPAEALLWEGLMSPAGFAIFAGLAIGMVTLLLLVRILDARWARKFLSWDSPAKTLIPMVAGGAAWLAATWWLWL